MVRLAVLTGLLLAGAAVPARAAGDPASVAAVEAFLRDDEKAMLAAVLSDKNAAAEFNADVKLAGSDPKIMKLVLDKWRGRVVAYAEIDAKIPNPDLEATYSNYGTLMTAKTKAYLVRRLKTMKEADRNSLIEYLDAVDSALSSNGGKLTWYTKKVVAGIFDKYREDLATYLPTPIAQGGKTAGPGAERALADLRKAATPPTLPPSVVSTRPGSHPPAVSTRTVSVPPTVVVSTSTSALDQARRAADAAERSGVVFDGGGVVPPTDGGVVAGAPGSGRPPLAAPSNLGGPKPSLVGEVPSPNTDDDDFRSSIKSMKTGPGPLSPRKYMPAGAGVILGGLIGFLFGGPIGALIGAGLGLLVGDVVGSKLFK